MTCGVLGFQRGCPWQRGEKGVQRPFLLRTPSSPLLNPALLHSADPWKPQLQCLCSSDPQTYPRVGVGLLKVPRNFRCSWVKALGWPPPGSACR